jgi:hypothetical protein
VADGTAPVLATFRFVAFVLLAVLGPGIALQRLVRVRWDLALVVPLGLVACATAYWLSLVTGAPWLFPALVVVLDLLLVPLGVRGRRAEGPSLVGALPPLVLLVALFALTQYRVNLQGPDGTFRLDVGDHIDTAVHVGVTWELVTGYPPQVPGLAGVPMRYHVGSHLVRAAAARWAGIHPYDSLNRFDITLWAVALVLALRAAAQALGLGMGALALAGFLPLASDLSFVPGLLFGARYWASRLGGNFLEPLFFANSISPALALVLAAVVALRRAERKDGRGWLALAAILGAGTGFFKVFAGAQLLLALGGAWLVRRDRRNLPVLAAPVALALAVLALSSIAPSGTESVRVAIVPFAPANPARVAFDLPEVRGLALAASGLGWLVLSLGLRAAGIPGAWRALRQGDAPSAALGAFALVGWPIALVLSVTADPAYDEALYFPQSSGLLLWLFAAPALAALARRSLPAAALAAGLCLPATAEFLLRKAAEVPEPIPATAVRAMEALRAASCPGDVVLTRPGVASVPLPIVLAGRRVALANYIPYWRQFTTPEVLAEREELVRSFFRTRDPVEAVDIARKLGARYVYLPGRPRQELEASGVLAPLFSGGREQVYRIAPLAPAHGCR